MYRTPAHGPLALVALLLFGLGATESSCYDPVSAGAPTTPKRFSRLVVEAHLEDGTPVEGVVLRLTRRYETSKVLETRTVTTGPDGTATFEALGTDAGKWWLAVLDGVPPNHRAVYEPAWATSAGVPLLVGGTSSLAITLVPTSLPEHDFHEDETSDEETEGVR